MAFQKIFPEAESKNRKITTLIHASRTDLNMTKNDAAFSGLTDEQVLRSRSTYGANIIRLKQVHPVVDILKKLALEPMVVLLVATSSIYFIAGDTSDGIFLFCAVFLVAAISIYQDRRSHQAMLKLQSYLKSKCQVVRNGKKILADNSEIVVGDLIIAEEGHIVAADARIIRANDFSVSESMLTGESLPVYKDAQGPGNDIFQGTTVVSGLAWAEVTAVGEATRLGRLGKSLESIKSAPSPLEKQIRNFVKKMVFAGSIVFVAIWAIQFFLTHSWTASFIKALTLAMSILPEEIPVAFTTFMALGAWRLMKTGIVVRQTKTIETLGSATVICIDKTGTITENNMRLAKVYIPGINLTGNIGETNLPGEAELVTAAMWASETSPFDPMETEIHKLYARMVSHDERKDFRMIHEYHLEGKPPMMTHVFSNSRGRRIIAAKGAPEAILNVSDMEESERSSIELAVRELAGKGYRLLGVGLSDYSGEILPAEQQQIRFTFKGILAFYDPPKRGIQQVLDGFYQAGMSVRIITGDNPLTTQSIAREIGFKGVENMLSGEEIMQMPDDMLNEKIRDVFIFARMFPEAKLRVVNAFRNSGEVVAMIGDGVNDGPALKAAHIGIAMGKKGTDVAREAASLVLVNDDLSLMLTAVSMGRRIYSNLKKAVQYIISIHIPIILVVFIPLAFGWIYPDVFSPVHVIFLELIMGPTCSIVYENEPVEPTAMQQPPRPASATFFNSRDLLMSIVQGLAITLSVLAVYRFAAFSYGSEQDTRTMVFMSLVTSNIFLTLVSRSKYVSLLSMLKYKNRLLPLIISLTIGLTAALVYLKPCAMFFGFERPSPDQVLISISSGFLAVIWIEAVKAYRRTKLKKPAVAVP